MIWGLSDVGNPAHPPGTRYDARDVEAFMHEHSAHVSRVQLDAYVGYWVARQSMREIADLEGRSWQAISDRVNRLRRRVRKWVARKRPPRAPSP